MQKTWPSYSYTIPVHFYHFEIIFPYTENIEKNQTKPAVFELKKNK